MMLSRNNGLLFLILRLLNLLWKKKEIIISYIREDMEKPIRFVVLASCPGGQTQHVEYLHDYCKALNLNVEVYIIGLCFSAAILILGIAQKGKKVYFN